MAASGATRAERSSDAMSGHAGVNAAAGSAAGATVLALLFPVDLAKTYMQANGTSAMETARVLLRAERPLHRMYRGLVPALAEQSVNRAVLFGVGALLKQHIPLTWPEPARDAACGAGAAIIKTTALHPLDSVKCRWQLGKPLNELGGLYHGLSPALVRSSLGMAIWLSSRNHLERTLPRAHGEGESSRWSALRHMVAGALSSALTDICTFPFDTLKKGMQAVGGASGSGGSAQRSLLVEMQRLHMEGGVARFYKGYAARVLLISVNGAVFNATFELVKGVIGKNY
jgi:hypothetical protein